MKLPSAMAISESEEWDIEILPLAYSDLDQLDDSVRSEAMEAIDDLGEDPFTYNAEKMRGWDDLYRIYFSGNRYRIVYRVSEKRRRVIVWRVRPRGSVYAGLERW